MITMGYARVSTKEQNLDRQIVKFKELGIEDRYIFTDKVSGATFDREQYKLMKNMLREGDLIYIDALDRLGRTYDGIIEEWKYITRKINADIVILENQKLFDSRAFKGMGEMGKLMEDQFLSLLSYVAEQERLKIKKRQAEGIAIAKQNGTPLGRPKADIPSNFEDIYSKWKSGTIKGVEAMKLLNLKKTTFYSLVKEYEQDLGMAI